MASINIQWKGTDVCLDMYCDCGVDTHFDGYFASALECGECGKKYDNPNHHELEEYTKTHTTEKTKTDEEILL